MRKYNKHRKLIYKWQLLCCTVYVVVAGGKLAAQTAVVWVGLT